MALMISIATTLAASFLLFCLQKTRQYFRRLAIKRQHGCQPPQSTPSKDPFLGLDSVYRILRSVKENRRNLSLKEQLDLYGYTFQSNLFGKIEIFTAEPQNLQAIFATDFESFGVEPMRLFVFEPLLGKGIMTTDGAHWAHSRALLQPVFSRTQIADYSSFEIHVARLIDRIPKNGSTVDLQPLFAKLALDSSSEFLFGESLGLLSGTPTSGAQQFLHNYSYAQRGIGRRLQLPRWNVFTRDAKFWDSCALARRFVEQYVEQALSHRSKKESERAILADGLSKVTQDRDEMRNQLLNVFLPAHDAIAVALTNVFFNLSRHLDVWSRLREEVLDLGDAPLTFERLKRLTFLQCVIKETLRLFPTIGSVGRVALRDTTIPTGGGKSGISPILIRKGDSVRTSFYALHRRKDLYGEDAERFDPGRWEKLDPPRWCYLPFGGGPRVCPGQQLGIAEVSYAIVRILQTFQGIENRDPVSGFVESYKITTESKNGAKVSLTVGEPLQNTVDLSAARST